MALTPRRLETLAALRRAAEQAGGAAHYSLVAAAMRISAWTAYDLLRELEELGLVVRRYAHETPGAGRSRILFAPSAHQVDVAHTLNERLRAAFERFSSIGDEGAAVREFLAEPGLDLSQHLGFWLARLAATGRAASEAAVALLEGGADPATKIQAIAALGLGSTLVRLRTSRLARRLNQAAARLGRLLEEAATSPETELVPLVNAARAVALPI